MDWPLGTREDLHTEFWPALLNLRGPPVGHGDDSSSPPGDDSLGDRTAELERLSFLAYTT
jgi:hypothetical protein